MAYIVMAYIVMAYIVVAVEEEVHAGLARARHRAREDLLQVGRDGRHPVWLLRERLVDLFFFSTDFRRMPTVNAEG